jgi:ATP-dependent DNA helicase RecG
MTREQIASWADGGGSEVIEFKKTAGEVRAGAQSLCAMLNHRGGRVLFGVTPEGGVAAGDPGTNATEGDRARVGGRA